jgi:hypothetical protein
VTTDNQQQQHPASAPAEASPIEGDELNTIEKFDKDNVKALGYEVQEALEAIAASHGLTLAPSGRGSYDDYSVTMPKPEFRTATAAAEEFAEHARWFGLDADDFGREFTMDGVTYRITGILPKAKRLAVILTEVSRGKEYKVDGEKVAMALGKRVRPAA